MKKNLVPIKNGFFAQIDPIRLRRVAKILRDQIRRKVSETGDRYSFYSGTMSFVDAAIRQEIVNSIDLEKSPFISANYYHDLREGTLPSEYDREFTRAVSDFSVTLRGFALEEFEEIVQDGKTFAWMDFEEDGDWPDKVKFP